MGHDDIIQYSKNTLKWYPYHIFPKKATADHAIRCLCHRRHVKVLKNTFKMIPISYISKNATLMMPSDASVTCTLLGKEIMSQTLVTKCWQIVGQTYKQHVGYIKCINFQTCDQCMASYVDTVFDFKHWSNVDPILCICCSDNHWTFPVNICDTYQNRCHPYVMERCWPDVGPTLAWCWLDIWPWRFIMIPSIRIFVRRCKQYFDIAQLELLQQQRYISMTIVTHTPYHKRIDR